MAFIGDEFGHKARDIIAHQHDKSEESENILCFATGVEPFYVESEEEIILRMESSVVNVGDSRLPGEEIRRRLNPAKEPVDTLVNSFQLVGGLFNVARLSSLLLPPETVVGRVLDKQ